MDTIERWHNLIFGLVGVASVIYAAISASDLIFKGLAPYDVSPLVYVGLGFGYVHVCLAGLAFAASLIWSFFDEDDDDDGKSISQIPGRRERLCIGRSLEWKIVWRYIPWGFWIGVTGFLCIVLIVLTLPDKGQGLKLATFSAIFAAALACWSYVASIIVGLNNALDMYLDEIEEKADG